MAGEIRLTSMVRVAGWAGKLGPADLEEALKTISIKKNEHVLVGIDTSDDAGVYSLNDDTALVQTVDFITPVVDDPYTFGLIAAANSLSDVYAMGGTPITAMNLVCFPRCSLDLSVLREVLRGGRDKVEEAGAFIVGGHSVDDNEFKYGLSVTGLVKPSQVVRNSTAKPGDRLILTKPLGIGILTTAGKAGKAPASVMQRAINQMAMLNKGGAEAMQEVGVNACTDITGFGLLGHTYWMAKGSGVGIVIEASSVPFIEEAADFASEGIVPGGSRANKEFIKDKAEIAPTVSEILAIILCDAQTSGGLLISAPAQKAEILLEEVKGRGYKEAAIIGEVVEPPSKIYVK